jgi:hypothetical protein
MSNIAAQTDRLKATITSTVEALQRHITHLQSIHDQIPAEPANLPVEEATRMLNRLGFCVVPREVLERTIDVVETVSKGDEPEGYDVTARLHTLAQKLIGCVRAF